MVVKTEWKVEGQDVEGNWHLVGLQAVDPSCDHLAQRDHVVKQLREFGIKRYTMIRLAKYVTTIEIIGEDIRV
jgi:hypothetical protein